MPINFMLGIVQSTILWHKTIVKLCLISWAILNLFDPLMCPRYQSILESLNIALLDLIYSGSTKGKWKVFHDTTIEPWSFLWTDISEYANFNKLKSNQPVSIIKIWEAIQTESNNPIPVSTARTKTTSETLASRSTAVSFCRHCILSLIGILSCN